MSMTGQGLATAHEHPAPHLVDQPFFTRMAIAISALIVLSFAQWSLRGFVAFGAVPWWVHAHGAFMLSWLVVFVTQNVLAGRGAFDLHRRIGWAALAVLAGTGIFGSLAGFQALALHRAPPFFSNAYFLALTQVEIIAFVATVIWAVTQRRNTEWHRRLMLGATVLLLEPALGRLLPMPLLGGWGEWIALAIRVAPLVMLAGHDRSFRGAIHPATLWSAGIVIGVHLLVTALAAWPQFARLADALAAH